jgi:hypothetical protein
VQETTVSQRGVSIPADDAAADGRLHIETRQGGSATTVHPTTTDGRRVTVEVDKAFKVTGRRPPPPGRSTDNGA